MTEERLGVQTENIGPFDCPLHRNRVCSTLCPLFDADERDDGEPPEPSCLLTGAARALIGIDNALTVTPEEVEDGADDEGDDPTVADLLSDVAGALAGLEAHTDFVRDFMTGQLEAAGHAPPPTDEPSDPGAAAMKLLKS